MDGEELVGIVTERDVLKAVASGVRLEETRVSEVMSKDLITVGPGTSLREAAKVMAERWIRHLPVVDRRQARRGDVSEGPRRSAGRGLNEPEVLEQLVEASELVRERRLARIEHGAWD